MIAYITGATSGFGKAIAQKLAQKGYDMIITGRRKERLETLADELTRQYSVKVRVSCYDVRDNDAVEKAIVSLPQEWKNIDVLVNNAGLAVGAVGIQNGELDDWNRMIDTNIKGLLYVSHQIMPLMVARKSGHIINLGSVAGKEVYPNGNVYCATKHAVDAITKAMRVDMLPYGVKVSQICPGAAETEFSLVRYKNNKEAADKVYQGYQPLVAEDIADVVAYLVSLPKHVCINDLVITCLSQANATNFYKK
ncbi:MAG: SDR family NAD(P)-dependent oxidoreductase [Bacteroidales bacterium]|nr:SDR family NAD(P)-dependent oxidoreductase [Bacteroidales bacterium]